jgi:fumarate reductase flavoprotein subunit
MSGTLIVVGAGNAGLPAAIEAADRGSHVILIERNDFLGGMLLWSSATTSAAGTRMQLAIGIGDDSPQRHFDDCIRIGRGRNDPALLRLAVENAAESVNWLEDIGVPFTEESPRFSPEHELYSIPRSYYPVQHSPVTTGGFRGGGVIAERFIREIDRRVEDGKIELYLKTRVTGLLLEDGAVKGVRTGSGELRGDAVLLTTGGYLANEALVHEYHPQYVRFITLCGPHAEGDAIPMVESAGGGLVNMDLLIPLLGFVEDPDSPGFCRPATTLRAGRPPAIAGDIWVNVEGKRFIAEDQKSPDAQERAIMEQPGPVMWAVFDELMRIGFTHEINEFTRTKLSHIGAVVSAPTIENLAAKIGVSPENLRATVEDYNRGFYSGNDSLGRQSMPKTIDEGPFHAVRSQAATILSQGGVKVNDRLQVVRSDGSAIDGLFAAGEVIGAGQVMGDGFCSGMSVGAAITTGRLASRFALSRVGVG